MKKIIMLLMAIVMVLSLAACGRRKDTNKENPITTPTNDTILPETNPNTPQNIPDPEVDSNSTENDNSPLDENMIGDEGDIPDNDHNKTDMTDDKEDKDHKKDSEINK